MAMGFKGGHASLGAPVCFFIPPCDRCVRDFADNGSPPTAFSGERSAWYQHLLAAAPAGTRTPEQRVGTSRRDRACHDERDRRSGRCDDNDCDNDDYDHERDVYDEDCNADRSRRRRRESYLRITLATYF